MASLRSVSLGPLHTIRIVRKNDGQTMNLSHGPRVFFTAYEAVPEYFEAVRLLSSLYRLQFAGSLFGRMANGRIISIFSINLVVQPDIDPVDACDES